MSVPSDAERERIISQAEHLIFEMEAMASQASFVRDEILSSSPLPAEPSIKELYALLALFDGHLYLPALEAMAAGDEPQLTEPDADALLSEEPWNEKEFDEVLDRVKDARSSLVKRLRQLSAAEWAQTATYDDRNLEVAELVYGAIQHDAEVLRKVALRLHESRLSS